MLSAAEFKSFITKKKMENDVGKIYERQKKKNSNNDEYILDKMLNSSETCRKAIIICDDDGRIKTLKI